MSPVERRESLFRSALHRLARIKGELAWVIVGQALAAASGLGGVRLLTGLLTPDAYGQLALGMTVALFISQCVFGPLTNGIARFYAPAVEAQGLSGYLRATRRLAIYVAGVVGLIAIALCAGALVFDQSKWIALGLTTLLFSLLSGYNQILSSIQNAARQRSIVALHQGIESWTRIGFAGALILWLGATSTMTMVGYTSGIVVVLTSQYMFFRKIASSSAGTATQENWYGRITGYAWPFYAWSLFTWAQYSSDRWALALFGDAAEVGLYAALFQLGNNPITMASTMMMQLAAPIFYQRAGDGTDAQRNASVGTLSWRLTLLTLCVTGVVVVIALFIHKQIFQILVAAKYASVSPLLPYTILSGGIFAASQLLELSLMSQMKTRMLLYAKITAAVVGISLNFTGARFYGVAGVVASSVITWAIYFLWMVVLARRLSVRTTPQAG